MVQNLVYEMPSLAHMLNQVSLVHTTATQISNVHLNILLCPDLPSGLLLEILCHRVHALLFFRIRVTCSAHIVHPHFIIAIIFAEKLKL
jgi:hypothetical protein